MFPFAKLNCRKVIFSCYNKYSGNKSVFKIKLKRSIFKPMLSTSVKGLPSLLAFLPSLKTPSQSRMNAFILFSLLESPSADSLNSPPLAVNNFSISSEGPGNSLDLYSMLDPGCRSDQQPLHHLRRLDCLRLSL